MSYIALARKYRPRNFGELVGQSHVVRALTNALDSQRLHHAYLFTGTRGVGKTTVARILAKSLNCLGADGGGGITSSPCGVCQACRDIDAGRFIDYTELDAASNRGIDDVQTLLEQAVYKPVQGRFKVFMIDEVHMLTTPAFNAMLKTLEEPPDYLKFVLATTDPQKVPVTVLSRCLQFNLRPMAPDTVREYLAHVLHDEAVPVDPQSLRLLARAARGSMRDALSLTDQAIAFGAGQLSEANVNQMLGSVNRSHVFGLIEALTHGDGKTVVETVESLRLHGLNPASMLEEMVLVLQRMAVFQAVPEMADESDPDAADTARLAAQMPRDETQLLYSLCLNGRAELGLAPDEYAALTMVLLRLLAFKPAGFATAQAEKKTLTEAESTRQAASTPASPRAHDPAPGHVDRPLGQVLTVVDGAPPRRSASEQARATHLSLTGAPQGPLDGVAVPVRVQPESRSEVSQPGGGAQARLEPTEEGEFWHSVVRQLNDAELIQALVRELALQSQLIGRDTGQWMLRVERESLNQANARERLAGALRSIGHAVELVVEVGRVTDSPARRIAAVAAERQLAAEKTIFGDSFVQSMMRDFGAKIVPGSIKPV